METTYPVVFRGIDGKIISKVLSIGPCIWKSFFIKGSKCGNDDDESQQGINKDSKF